MKLELHVKKYADADEYNVFLLAKDGSALSMLLWYEGCTAAQKDTILKTLTDVSLMSTIIPVTDEQLKYTPAPTKAKSRVKREQPSLFA